MHRSTGGFIFHIGTWFENTTHINQIVVTIDQKKKKTKKEQKIETNLYLWKVSAF